MELLEAKKLLEGSHVDVSEKRYRRQNGEVVERQVVEAPNSVAVLAYDEEFVYLVGQPREPLEDDRMLEIPAGTLDVDGESALEAAKRELAEEVELQAESWSELRTIYLSPGFLDERSTIFEATGLSPASGHRDEEEAIEIVRLPLAELDRALAEIRDAKTLVALLHLKQKLATNP